jgi:hypothetical protein
VVTAEWPRLLGLLLLLLRLISAGWLPWLCLRLLLLVLHLWAWVVTAGLPAGWLLGAEWQLLLLHWVLLMAAKWQLLLGLLLQLLLLQVLVHLLKP